MNRTLRSIYNRMPANLSYGAKLFYLYVCSKIDVGESLLLGEETLAKEAGLGRKVVANAKKALVAAELIKVTSGAIVSRHSPDTITLL